MVHVGLGAWLVASLGLYLRLEVGLLEGVLAAFLVLTLPVLSVAQVPLIADTRLNRPDVYAGSAVALAGLTMACLVVGALGPGLEALSLGPVEWKALGIASLRLGVASAVLVGAFHLVSKMARLSESPILAELLPRTATERRLFAGLSVLAGFGEEVVFRGFLFAVLVPALGSVWTTLAVSSLAFGVLHVYQGAFGILRTAALGALLGTSVIVDGSLWPAVIVHIVIDLAGGLVFGPRMVPLSDPDGL
jgi:membrane protease YdiL (CAAX protease family)